MPLPKQVAAFKGKMSDDDSVFEVATKLIAEDPNLVAMWRSLEKRNRSGDDLWISAFLTAIADAVVLPAYHYLSGAKRRALEKSISVLANELAKTLESNKLDVNLIYIDNLSVRGFYAFEDFGDTNRQRIDADNRVKLHSTRLLREIAERSATKIRHDPLPGKAAKNAAAIHFARRVAARNVWAYGKPLNDVVATATNALFGTSYSAQEIEKLRSRAPRQSGPINPSD
jgi:hypothetical protein